MGKVLSTLLGGNKSPTVSTQAIDDTEEKKKKAKKSKAQVIATQGGVSGEELTPGAVGGTDTLFGN